ncbi:MAG: hypothetical protein ACK5JR_14660 [Tropicimonas sp.]|uniref:hypothetical protein n=1 Tax=Tropicimonas sp. TaxID=2067044 RepID=UPI003A8AB76B
MKPSNVFPKSSPAQFTAAFDRFCMDGPRSFREMDGALRAAGYVPVRRDRGRTDRLYVTDSKRPAVRLTSSTCAVVGTSRTGQTDAVRRYVRGSFPKAAEIAADRVGGDVEQAWLVGSDPQEIIGTGRFNDLEVGTRYALIRFRDGLYSTR